ncbi:hypothetical protein [Alkalicoccobacillus plakortidis]|uniref:Uncharacterized protein n=1 Tax=Alkalicoccobacillus plakortidis TaxID=444060 RepID=A0ABT0XIC2_9BACI|nr:hypothetical protein [Alkalicoccobacillus plakortidis]MCM2675510.1 hypothetical protein [Alkalicoccobacillus plakortidis]
MTFQEMQSLMKQAIPLAKQMEGDWQARMKLALHSVKVDHYMKQPISKRVIQKLLEHGVSYRRISKNYRVGRQQISVFEGMY